MKKPSPVKPKSLLTAPPLSKPNAHPHPRIVQPKIVIASQKPQQPVAPSVYRKPPRKVLQRKTAIGRLPDSVPPRPQAVAPAVYWPQHMRQVLQRKASGVPASPANAMKRGPVAPPVYRPQPVPKVLQTKQAAGQHPNVNHSVRRPGAPPIHTPARNGAGNWRAIQFKVASGGNVIQLLTADEHRWNDNVQALKAKVDELEDYINKGTLAAQTLHHLRTLRDKVTESIRLRTLLNGALGSDPGHVTRLANEEGFLAEVDAAISTKETAAAAAAQVRQNAHLAATMSALPATARWGSRT